MTKHDLLLLGGAYEFLPTSGDLIPEKKRDAVANAFKFLDYDLGILSPAEFLFLQQGPSGIPQNWINCEKIKVISKSLKNGKQVRIVILPYLKRGSDEIPEELLNNCRTVFKENRSKADIVIAMSSWGYIREKKLLTSPEMSETPPDILLGSGDGPGMTGNIAANGKTLWVRSYPTGKAVNRIDVFNFPERNENFKWTSGENIKWFLQTLKQNTREAPAVAELLNGIEDKK